MPKGVRSLARSAENVPFVPVVAVLFGIVAATLILATPGWLFERGVVASGLPDVIAAAAPPLGDKAQILAAILAAFGMALPLWLIPSVLGQLVKATRIEHQGTGLENDGEQAEHAPHPHAPARRPLFAESDLGAPFMSDEAFAHARDELVLGAIVADNAELPEQIAGEDAMDLVEPFEDPMFQSPDDVLTLSAVAVDQPSISGLLDRLENALQRRELQTGSLVPMVPGNMAALREILGDSTARH